MPSRVLVAKELAELFKLFSHPDRIRLVEELRGGEQVVSFLGERLDLPGTRVSQHLSLLRAHRIVEERREGRHVYYHLTNPDLAEWITDALGFIEARMKGDSQNRRALHQARRLWTGQ